MLIYMFSLSLVFSFPICLCSVAGSSVSGADSAGAGALERALDIRAFSAIKHLLERTVAALGWCDGMFWSLHVHRHQARLKRAAGMPVMVPAGEEMAQIRRELPQPSVGLGARGSFLPELQTPARLTPPYSS